jgi:hypothetical protein
MKCVLALTVLSLVMIGHMAKADTRSDVKAAFGRCDVFSDERTWLNCIYGAAQPLRSKLGLPPAPDSQINLVPNATLMPQAVPPPAPEVKRQKDNRGGIASFFLGGQKVLTNMPMTAYTIDNGGMFTLTLANGQVWREVEGSPVPHWRDPASRYTVSITKGSLDSYNLIIEGEGVQYKAKRLH